MKISMLLAAALAVICVSHAKAQEAVGYNIKYIEVLPASKTQAASLLKRYAEAARKEDGNLRFEILQRIDRPNHFAIVEAWKSPKAAEAHGAAAGTKDMRGKLDPILASSYDERPSSPLSVGEVSAGSGRAGRAIYVVTHVDVNSAKKDDGGAILKALAEQSRKESGNLRYEVLTQSNRTNHFTVVEIWKSEGALEEHESAKHTVQARQSIFPLSGALFDQRLYKPI